MTTIYLHGGPLDNCAAPEAPLCPDVADGEDVYMRIVQGGKVVVAVYTRIGNLLIWNRTERP